MSEPQVLEGIAPRSDHYVPRFGVYLGPPDAAPSDPPPAASLVDEENARAEEEERIRERTGVGANGRTQGSLQALDGPWGDPNGAITNDVISVDFSESLEPERLSSVRVRLLNVYDARARRFRYTDTSASGPIIDYGKTLALVIGYRDELTPVFEGMISTIDASFPSSSEATVDVTAVAKLERLRNKKLSSPHSFARVSVEQIAAEIARHGGLRVGRRSEQETNAGHTVRVTADQDLMQFLIQQAQDAALELGIFGNTILLRTPGDAEPTSVLRYEYRRGLLSFTPRLNSAGLPTRVRVRVRLPTSGERIDVTSTPARLTEQRLAPSGGSPILSWIAENGQAGEREEVVTNRHATSRDEAQRLADAIMKRHLDRMLTASGEVIGDPRLRAGSMLRIAGVGRYDGDYYVTQATHSFGDDGYRTSFESHRNMELATEDADAAG